MLWMMRHTKLQLAGFGISEKRLAGENTVAISLVIRSLFLWLNNVSPERYVIIEEL